MDGPNNDHLTDAEDTILVEISGPSIPITPEMRNRPRIHAKLTRPTDPNPALKDPGTDTRPDPQ